VTFVPKVKIDTVIPDNLLDKVIETVGKAARTGKIGDGKIIVCALEQAGPRSNRRNK
jgi:nitrogen regulatory protein P-II 2